MVFDNYWNKLARLMFSILIIDHLFEVFVNWTLNEANISKSNIITWPYWWWILSLTFLIFAVNETWQEIGITSGVFKAEKCTQTPATLRNTPEVGTYRSIPDNSSDLLILGNADFFCHRHLYSSPKNIMHEIVKIIAKVQINILSSNVYVKYMWIILEEF